MSVDDIEPMDAIHAIYLDWVNNYLTVDKFARDYDIPREVAECLIDRGMTVHDNRTNPKPVRLVGGIMTSRSAMDQ